MIKQPEAKEQTLSAPVSYAIFLSGLLIILYSTLRPFTFQFQDLAISALLAGYVLPPSSVLDFVRNILLFMPMGFGLGALLDRRHWQNNNIRLAVLTGGFFLTLLIETLQNFLPGRQPSLSDLLTNTLSALLGLGAYRVWQNRAAVIQLWNKSMALPARVFAILAAYTLLLLLLSIGLVSSFSPQRWAARYNLMIGNEQVGDRIWRGTARDLLVLSSSVTDDQVDALLTNPESALAAAETTLAYYPLHGEDGFSDKSGRQPDLIWRTYDPMFQSAPAAQFDGRSWLESESAVRDLTRSIEESSQFAVRLTVMPANTQQSGPARLVTISENPFERNLMLGQEGTALIVRLRSYITGKNGDSPEIAFPDFFSDTESTDFLVSFDGLSLTLFDSRSQNAEVVELVPGLALFALLKPFQNGNWQITSGFASNWGLRLLFYVLALLPVSIIISQPAIAGWPRFLRAVVYLVSLLLIPFLMEFVMAKRAGTSLRPAAIVAATMVTAVLTLLLAQWIDRRGKASEN